jgi:hypothetical protein
LTPLKARCRRPSSCCSKALKLGLKPIVAINKIDKPEERAEEVLDEVFDLFAALDANNDQLDFPVLYGSAKQGWMALEPTGPQDNMDPLFDLVVTCRLHRLLKKARSAAGDHHRIRCVPRPHPDRPCRFRHGHPEHGHQGPVARRQADRDRPRLENPRLPWSGASADRKG